MVGEFLVGLVNSFGYLGVFVSMLLANMTVFFPVPSFVIIITASAFLNPLLVGAVSAAGGAIGTLTAYAIGYGGNIKLKKNLMKNSWFKKAEKMFHSRLGPIAIIIFTALPFATDDVMGVICGAVKYEKKKFLIFTFIGKFLLYTTIAYAGAIGIDFLINYL